MSKRETFTFDELGMQAPAKEEGFPGNKNPEGKPFHVSIVEIMNEKVPAVQGMCVVGYLLLATEIPKNHQAILDAWKDLLERNHRTTESFMPDVRQKLERELEALRERGMC